MSRNATFPRYSQEVIWVSVILLLCSCKKNADDRLFFERTVQETEERLIVDTLRYEKKVKLSDFGIYNPGRLIEDKGRLYIEKDADTKVLTLKIGDFSDRYWIGPGKGRGPNESLDIASIDVLNGHIASADVDNMKILIHDTGNNLVSEFNTEVRPRRIELLSGQRIVVTAQLMNENIFYIYTYEGEKVHSFENKDPMNQEIMPYDGTITTDNDDNIYYAGFPEPILKKYGSDGELIFSRATIDNWNSEANYVKNVSANTMMMRYAPGALFSTYGYTVYKDFIIVRPHHNEIEELHHVVDVYAASNGDYLHSVIFDNDYPLEIAVTDEKVFTLEWRGGEYYLKIYPNTVFGS